MDTIAELARKTSRPEVLRGIGGFGALFRAPRRYRRPLWVASTDGVGTKLRVALAAARHREVGIDLVAMNVNDVLTLGAEPLVFLDYFATGRLETRVAKEVLAGIAEGCREAGCALVGGEIAELPSFYPGGEYDLAGFVVGVVEEKKVVDGRDVREGDAVIGLASAGLHSNGFSLVRRVLLDKAALPLDARIPELGCRLADELLRPTRIYVPLVRRILTRFRVKAMAHITGGGLVENVPRVLPEGHGVVFWKGTWPVPPIFDLVARLGPVGEREMYRTFNMGVGFVLVVERKVAPELLGELGRGGEQAWWIGEIRRGPRAARFEKPKVGEKMP